MVQALAEKNGIQLNIGDTHTEPVISTDSVEGPQPKDVASRVTAHIMHRIPGIRKLEKRLEGKELKSGILSDLAALGVNIYARNEDAFNSILSNVLSGKMSHKGNPTENGRAPHMATHIDFGQVVPSQPTQGE